MIAVCFLAAPAGSGLAQDGTPTNLDTLVLLALERHPQGRALIQDDAAAVAAASAARRPMDPQWMAEAVALGAMPDAPDPTMFMFGFTQMLELPVVYRSRSERAVLAGEWAQADRERLAANLRLQLAQAAARLAALSEEAALLDRQVAVAQALFAIGVGRYGAGADLPPALSGTGMSGASAGPGIGSGAGAVDLPQPPPPTDGAGMVGMGAPSGAAGGGASMGAMSGPGMGSGGTTGPSGMGAAAMAGNPAMGGMGQSGAMGGGGAMGGSGSSLGSLLRLDGEITRVKAEQAVLLARLAGEVAVLAVLVGEDAARAMAQDPERYLESTSQGPPPELSLSRLGTRSAEASLSVERSERLPDFMLGAGVRLMPDGMFAGTDVAVGVSFPLYGTNTARITAAEAQLQAASERQRDVERQLLLTATSAEAELAAAIAWSQALDQSLVPRASAALNATRVLYAADRAGVEDVLRAWQAALEVEREAVGARLDTRLRAADLARVEIP